MNLSRKFVSECREHSTYLRHVAAPIFRKSFLLSQAEAQGEILICGLGFYDLFVNGYKITKGFLAPYISNTDHITYYDRYDIAPWLCQGENVIGVMLGDGFQNGKTRVWDFMDNVFNSAPKLGLSVYVRDGEEELTFDATDFMCKKGPVWFNDLRSGVFYDKRREEQGWNAPGFVEDETWHRPIPVEEPRGGPRICDADPIVVRKELAPVKIWPGEMAAYRARPDVYEGLYGQDTPEKAPEPTGGYIYDFGENNAGIFRLRIKGFPGQRIDIQCSEELLDGKIDYNNIGFYPDGYVQRDIYILGSEEEEVFEPMFTYHGFRYLYVSGITPEQATESLLTYLVMSSDLEERGSYESSDQTADKICEIGRRSDLSNFYYFPTDCPHREKNGWTGDAAASAEHIMLTLGAERSYREWLNNIRPAMHEEGMLPGIVPTGHWGYDWGNGPAWDRALFEIPYRIYQYRGDTDIIRENAHAMLRYLEYISRKRDEKGIVAVGLGDWVPVDRGADDYEIALGFTDTVMVYDMCCKGQEMFGAVGLGLHKAFAAQLGKEVLEAVRRQYIDYGTMTVKGASQSGQALAIYHDIFTNGEKPEAVRRLLEFIHRDGDKVTCGYLGLRVIFHVLAEAGEWELAYGMITGKTYPSYGYFVEQGDTTMPEQFLPQEQRHRISQNHHFLADVSHWFIRYPGGIHVKNSREVSIRPKFIESLTFVKARHRLPEGEVTVSWKREGQQILLEITCPDNVACELVLEEGYWLLKERKAYLERGTGSYQVVSKRS